MRQVTRHLEVCMSRGSNNDAPEQAPAQPGTAVAITNRDLVQKFANMATILPLEAGGSVEPIIEAILDAGSWDELDSPWETSKAEQLMDRRLKLERAERRPSDFREGVGFFLVLHCVDVDKGERIVATTSSLAIIAQVVRAHALGAMPLFFEFVIAERPTAKGYKPHHLKILGTAASVSGESASAS